jgi:hypothetical protein
MAELIDIHGKKYHSERRTSSPRTNAEWEAWEKAVIKVGEWVSTTRMVMVDEAGKEVTSPIDVGSHRYVPQVDGTWKVEKLVGGNM